MTDGQRILVVDDQQDIRDMTALVLAGAGYRVDTVDSGESALSALEQDRFDLVLLDINMPEMDGWETLRLIRCDEELTGLPVVMFSVKGEIRDKIESLQEGADDFVTKPFI
ncbi:MAG: response regulator, partial [Acidobacteriota bacterium]